MVIDRVELTDDQWTREDRDFQNEIPDGIHPDGSECNGEMCDCHLTFYELYGVDPDE